MHAVETTNETERENKELATNATMRDVPSNSPIPPHISSSRPVICRIFENEIPHNRIIATLEDWRRTICIAILPLKNRKRQIILTLRYSFKYIPPETVSIKAVGVRLVASVVCSNSRHVAFMVLNMDSAERVLSM